MSAMISLNSKEFIEELMKDSVVQFDPAHPLKSWISSALKHYDQAIHTLNVGDLETAYINYIKATSIVVDYVPKHYEFSEYLKEPSYIELKEKILEITPAFESVKLKLETILDLHLPSYTASFNISPITPQNPVTHSLHNEPISKLGNPGVPVSLSPLQPAPSGSGRSRPIISKPKGTLVGPNSSDITTSRRSTSYSVPHTTTILPETLYEYLDANNPLSLLILDTRPKEEFSKSRIRGKYIINIEPSVLREDVTSSKIEAHLVSSSQSKQDLFHDRSKFDLVVIYDKNSRTLDQRILFRDGVAQENPLQKLVRALYDSRSTQKTKRKPVLLVGGFDAWWDAYGLAGCTTETEQPMPQEQLGGRGNVNWQMHLSKRSPDCISLQRADAMAKKLTKQSVISPALGRPIARNVLDYFQAQTTVSPQPAVGDVKPKPTKNGLRLQFDYFKLNRKGSRPARHATPKPSTETASHGLTKLTDSAGLQIQNETTNNKRRSSFLDNPYYGFTVTKNQFGSPPPTPRRPLPEIPPKDDRTPPVSKSAHKMVISPVFESSVKALGSVRIGTTGLRNLGNTCFMNSILQCLSGTIPLARYFLDGSYKRHINKTNFLGTGGVLAEAFGNLIRVMWSEQYDSISPVTFREAIGRFASQFQGYEQQDAQELLAFLLDGLHEDLNLVVVKPAACDDDDDDYLESLSEEEASNLAWEKYILRNSSIIVGLFQGQFRSRLKCTFCQHTSTTYNAFMYLSLPIPKNKERATIQDCLDEFVREEILEGDDAWFCSRCKERRRAIKSLTISRLPDVLLIHLKRFSFNGPFRDKINNLVKYPLRGLNLTDYVPLSVNRPTSQYDLFGVSNHIGGLNGGHYTAHIKNGYRGQWHYFDDSRVSVCEESKVMSKSAYILFYVRSAVN